MDFIIILKAAILGIVEGATEFIPVSSTGHLILIQDWLGFSGRKENAFAIFIQLGAILAVVWLYRRKLLSVVMNCHRDSVARKFIANIVIATLPAVIIGLPTEEWIEIHFFNPLTVAFALLTGGIAILLTERTKKNPVTDSVDDISCSKAFGIGMIQVLAILFPGMSRSACTIMGGLALGLSRTAAAEFSFFLAIPAMLGASAIKLIKVRDILTSNDLPFFATGFAVSFVTAFFAIRCLMSFISNHTFNAFAWYRIVLGAVLLAVYLV